MKNKLFATIDIEVPIYEGQTEEDALLQVTNLIWEINAAMYPMKSNSILTHEVKEVQDEY